MSQPAKILELDGRVPPQAVEVEESVLGACLMEAGAMDVALEMLRPDDFYRPANKHIFEAIIALASSGDPVDLITIESKLKEKNQFDQVGIAYLADLTRSVSSAANVDYHCQIIKEKAIKRDLILSCTETIKECYDPSSDTYDVVDRAQERVFGVVKEDSGNLIGIADSLHAVAKRVMEIQERGEPIGLRSGLDLDQICGGFQDGKLYVLGARPSMGKTALVMTIMRRIAKDGFSTGIISLETSHDSLSVRLISQVTGIPAEKITSGKMNPDELERFMAGCNALSSHKIYLDDSAGVSAQQLRSKCRIMAKKGVQIIFIDFLQLILQEGRSRHEEIGKITKTAKAIAKELSIPIVLLSQLTRKVEERTNKRPLLSDLRESGSIEEDADVIMFLYRPEYYGITTDETGRSTEGVADIIIAKNKDGRTGTKPHFFEKETMTFKNLNFETRTDDSPF